MGWTEHDRNARYLCGQINHSINHINGSGVGYHIDCDAYTKIEGQAKFIEILQRQIAIAEKYIINDNGRDTRVD